MERQVITLKINKAMTDKDKKLAEEILVKRGFFVMTHKEGSEHVRKVFIEPVLEAMQEYAEAWHSAKMQEQKIVESFDRENEYVTDEDIRKWIFSNDPVQDGDEEWLYGFRQGKLTGAKAMRDGNIKHKER